MRIAIAANHLPAKCDIAGIEPVNYSWLPKWSASPTPAEVIQAFSNSAGWACKVFVLDQEPPCAREYQDGPPVDARRTHLAAIAEACRATVDGELWDYNSIGSPQIDVPNQTNRASRWMQDAALTAPYLVKFDCIGPCLYPIEGAGPTAVDLWINHCFRTYQYCASQTGRRQQIVAHIAHRYAGEHGLVPLRVFARYLRRIAKEGFHGASLWHHPSFSTGDYVAELQPYIDVMKEFTNA